MARVQYGSIVTELKGSVGGQVFQAGNNSLVLRNKGYRKGTSSTARQAANRLISSQASDWRTLSVAQQSAWATAALSWPFVDKFGNTYYGTGYQCFIAYNSARLSILQPAVVTPSAPIAAEAFSISTFAVSVSGGMVFTETAATTTVQVVQQFFSAPLSQGVNNNNVRYRNLGQFNTSDGGRPFLTPYYQSIFGSFQVGQKIVMKAVMRVRDYPLVIQTQIMSAIVTA